MMANVDSLTYLLKVASPLGGYKHVVTAEQMYGIIEQVHKHEVCHSGVFKTFKKVSYSIHYFIDLLFWSYKKPISTDTFSLLLNYTNDH